MAKEKPGLLLSAFFKANTFSRSTLLWPKNNGLAASGLFQGHHIFTKKNGFAAAGLFQGHHIFTINFVMEKEKRACCWGPFSRPPHFHDHTCNGQRKTRLAAADLFQGHHIFTIKIVMAKEKRSCCCGNFSRPPHFHDQTSNCQRKTGLLLPAFFKETTFSRSDL